MPAKSGSWYHDGNDAPDGADTALIPDMEQSLGHVPKFGGILYFVSATGNDANDGLDPCDSFLTIQHAIDTGCCWRRDYDYGRCLRRSGHAEQELYGAVV